MGKGLAPAKVLLIGGSLAILFSVLVVLSFLDTPWLGLELAYSDDGRNLVVESARGPANGVMHPGDRIAGFEEAGALVEVNRLTLLDQPNSLKNYTDYHAFLAQQARLADALSKGELKLVLADGRRLTAPTARRPWSSLPPLFWFQLLCGVTAFLVGLSVFSARKRDLVSTIFLVSGTGVLVFTGAAAIYTSRELALDTDRLGFLLSANYLGSFVFGASLPALLWNYPTALGPRWTTVLWYLLAALIWGIHELELTAGPLLIFNAGAVPIFTAILFFALRQWRATRGSSVARATLNWMLRPMLLCCTSYLLLYMVPVTLDRAPVMPESLSYGLKLLMYLGFAVGITRYRLFELERWWFEIWVWIGGGLLVALLDAVLLLWLDLNSGSALAFSLVIAGWLYFPLRQYLWRRFSPASGTSLERHLPKLMEAIVGARTKSELGKKWHALLYQMFSPVSVSHVDRRLAQPMIGKDGLTLLVPGLEGERGIELTCAHKGSRLFVPEDVRLASTMLTLSRQAAELRTAQERGAQVERQRIMRDLHDDVGAKLLTLFYRADSPAVASLSQEALQSLRDVIASTTKGDSHLDEVLADIRAETEERAEAAGIALNWTTVESLPACVLTGSERINLVRVVREAVTNAIRHANPRSIHIHVERDGGQWIRFRVEDDGAGIATADCEPAGRGMRNMRTRIEELAGQVSWHRRVPKGTMVEFSFPVTDSSEEMNGEARINR